MALDGLYRQQGGDSWRAMRVSGLGFGSGFMVLGMMQVWDLGCGQGFMVLRLSLGL